MALRLLLIGLEQRVPINPSVSHGSALGSSNTSLINTVWIRSE